MELKILNIKGKETGKSLKVSDKVFKVTPNDHAIYLDVKRIQAGQHQGTHKAKERGEIVGSTRKIKKQKGTGSARAGSIKNPLFKGGGRIFGPRVRSYDITLNSKTKKIAKRSALSYKAKENTLLVVDSFKMKAPKTKEYIEMLKDLNVSEGNSLFVIASANESLYKSGRNIQNTCVMGASELNTYEIMKAKNIVFEEAAIVKLEDNLK
jgi:large subunit ribosomal protein L4